MSMFAAAAIMLYVAGDFLVSGLLKLSRFFKVKEFIVAFFVMAFASTIPNFFVGVSSALQGIPELSFGEIMGNNMIILTLSVVLALIFSPKRELPLDGKTIQDTTLITTLSAVLPLLLIFDGTLSRADGVVLVLLFAFYSAWIYSKRNSFSSVYENEGEAVQITRPEAMRSITKVVFGVVLLAVSAQLIVMAATTVAALLAIPLLVMGVFGLALGGALPELYFTYISARRGETSLLLGNIMGAVIIQATLILGVVAIISPIHNESLHFPLFARLFTAAVALFFLYLSRTRNVITRKESAFLVCAYIGFVISLLVF